MAVLFNKQLGSSLLKENFDETPIALASADQITYVATQTGIYQTTTGSKFIKIYDSIKRIRNLHCIPHINIIIIVYDENVELRNIENIRSQEKHIISLSVYGLRTLSSGITYHRPTLWPKSPIQI